MDRQEISIFRRNKYGPKFLEGFSKVDDFEKELKLGFLDEAAQSIADVEQCFLDLETNPTDSENLNKIFRLAHNLKGSSKAVGFEQMGAFTHEFETFILKIKNGELPSSPVVVTLLLQCNDFVGQMITGLKGDLDAQFDIQPLLEQMQSVALAGGNAPEAEASTPEEETSVPINEPSQHENVVSISAPFVETPVTATASAAPAPAPSAPPKEGANKAVAEESIRVSVAKVESLLNFIGEMVILQSVIKEQALATQSMALKKSLHQFEKVTKEVQDLSMSLRMVPVKPTFQKMQRIVRDTAQALSKDVSIVLVGEDTELDKTVLEKINDPLVHLIRNSVDHGIENDVKLRTERGKPARGQVTLSASHQNGKLVIEVSDDGGGLDGEKLTKKAIEKGLLRPGTVLSEKDAHNLIFAPGFSTKEAVTDVSGRGVGMDVVRTNIQDLSGEIIINSVLGKGTTFQIVLPLTLAIIEGMILKFSEDRYIIPFAHVFETLRPTTKDLQITSGLGSILMLRGENMPIFKLGDFFGKRTSMKSEDMIAMVIRNGPKPFALLVDDILGQSQVVVKQLGRELQGFQGASGCTILGDGKPALILEPTELVKRKMTAAPAAAPKIEPLKGGKAA